MEDHDTGAGAPEVGVSRASPPPSGQASPSAGRQNGRPVQPWSGHGQAGDASQHQNGQNQKAKTRKRRKRRRGRRVFVRDDAHLAAAALSAAADSAPASRPPEAIVAPLPSAAPSRPEQDVRRSPAQELPVFAALDLGTNNCRLLVAVPTRHGQFRVIDAFSRIVRLGEGLTANGRLGQPAMDRAVEALKICGDKLRSRKIRKARLIATEACRTAANGAEFLD
ncbi:Ppx/GppA phosphatase family protein, partial [Mesorhizobium sp.]